MTFRLDIEKPKFEPFALEAEAKDWTWRAWRRRDVGRLFPSSELEFTDENVHELLARLNAAFAWKAVGLVIPTRWDEHVHSPCIVGTWLPNDFEVRLESLSGPGSTHHRGVALVGWVTVLPELYQRVSRRNLRDDDATCGYCDYTFKEGEAGCRSCGRCAMHCFGQGYYPLTCSEADPFNDPHHLTPEETDALYEEGNLAAEAA